MVVFGPLCLLIRPFYKGVIRLLLENRHQLPGAQHPFRSTRMMVTLPLHAATDYDFVLHLIQSGMDCARIDCSLHHRDIWECMIDNVRRAELEAKRNCKILMELSGHGVNLQVQEAGPDHPTISLMLSDDDDSPRHVLLCNAQMPDYQPQVLDARCLGVFAIPARLHREIKVGDRLRWLDRRGKTQCLHILSQRYDGCWLAACSKKLGLQAGVIVDWLALQDSGQYRFQEKFSIGKRIAGSMDVILFEGDRVLLQPNGKDSKFTVANQAGLPEIQPLACTWSPILSHIQIGDHCLLADGQVHARVVSTALGSLLLRVTRSKPHGVQLGQGQRIRFPGSAHPLGCLSDKDRRDLDWIAAQADMVACSFISSPAQLQMLQQELSSRNAVTHAIVVRICSQRCIENLQAMMELSRNTYRLGVIVGTDSCSDDVIATEQASAEAALMQMCARAHLPVVWDSHELNALPELGVFTRQQLQQAMKSPHIHGLSLRHGPYLLRAVRTVDVILSERFASEHLSEDHF